LHSLKRRYHGHGRFSRSFPPAAAEVEEAMKTMGVAAIAVMAGGSVWAGAIPAERRVTVCMGDTPNLGFESRAKGVASDIFAGMGVKIQWHRLSNCPAASIIITFSDVTPESLMPGAMAYALPYEGTHIVVLYDRVKNKRGQVPCLLGHVMAHEITHVLQGVARHSESGVMKAQWTGMDYKQMTWKPLQFTDEDVQLINRGLEVREKALVVVATATANGSGTASR
jgi:hypothetical protein